jgi:FKBP-type peptidyl-prolyl cis-trans isomerase
MLNKFETTGIVLSVGLMVLALYLFRIDSSNETLSSIKASEQSATVFVAEAEDKRAAVANALVDASDVSGDLEKIIVDDVVIGSGETVKIGDTVSVHYIGTLQNGQQFDNSYLKGSPFKFKVGAGRVIKGWDEGLVGMKIGGQRILVIPPALAYGKDGAGPIPGNATLVFAIELISIE